MFVQRVGYSKAWFLTSVDVSIQLSSEVLLLYVLLSACDTVYIYVASYRLIWLGVPYRTLPFLIFQILCVPY